MIAEILVSLLVLVLVSAFIWIPFIYAPKERPRVNRECPKCGMWTNQVRYIENKDHLALKCEECEYSFIRPTLENIKTEQHRNHANWITR